MQSFKTVISTSRKRFNLIFKCRNEQRNNGRFNILSFVKDFIAFIKLSLTIFNHASCHSVILLHGLVVYVGLVVIGRDSLRQAKGKEFF